MFILENANICVMLFCEFATSETNLYEKTLIAIKITYVFFDELAGIAAPHFWRFLAMEFAEASDQ